MKGSKSASLSIFKPAEKVLLNTSLSLLVLRQTERHSPLLGLRSRPSLDGGKMRASVRMTRYLESWGAAKPFANLHQRDSLTTDNGKINTTVSTSAVPSSFPDIRPAPGGAGIGS